MIAGFTRIIVFIVLEQRRKQQAEAKEAEEAIAEQINEQLPEFISETLDDLLSGFKMREATEAP